MPTLIQSAIGSGVPGVGFGRRPFLFGLTSLPLRSWNDAAVLGLLMHVNDELAGWRTAIVLPIVFLLPGSDGDPTVGLGAPLQLARPL